MFAGLQLIVPRPLAGAEPGGLPLPTSRLTWEEEDLSPLGAVLSGLSSPLVPLSTLLYVEKGY